MQWEARPWPRRGGNAQHAFFVAKMRKKLSKKVKRRQKILHTTARLVNKNLNGCAALAVALGRWRSCGGVLKIFRAADV
jgi:hypothetical protein